MASSSSAAQTIASCTCHLQSCSCGLHQQCSSDYGMQLSPAVLQSWPCGTSGTLYFNCDPLTRRDQRGFAKVPVSQRVSSWSLTSRQPYRVSSEQFKIQVTKSPVCLVHGHNVKSQPPVRLYIYLSVCLSQTIYFIILIACRRNPADRAGLDKALTGENLE